TLTCLGRLGSPLHYSVVLTAARHSRGRTVGRARAAAPREAARVGLTGHSGGASASRLIANTTSVPHDITMRCLNASIIGFALLVRILVGFHPHSGQEDYQGGETVGRHDAKAKKYGGDYEAQRHWMEITYHLPISEWYHHDLEYWGLDYPPLTAYVSWACGWVAHNLGALGNGGKAEDVCTWDDSVCIDKAQKNNRGRKPSEGLGVLRNLVALHSSRWGFEETGGKIYMRFTVLVLDLVVYMSAVWVLTERLAGDEGGSKESAVTGPKSTTSPVEKDDTIIPIAHCPRLWLLLTALLQPALILIDHGHFQYNTVSLGLAMWSFHFMTLEGSNTGHPSFFGPILGSIMFCLALNFKQMELYHAPAVFAYLLGRCFRQSNKSDQSTKSMGAASKFCVLGFTVICTFAALWAPFAIYTRGSTTSLTIFNIDGIMQLIRRLFPFERGIFEGKVANLWCALSVKPFSIRHRLPSSLLPWMALGLTFMLIIPPCWFLFWAGKSSSHDGVKTSQQSNVSPEVPYGRDIRLLLWGTSSTSLAFFLASFQVHEKGILIPLAPISLLALDAPRFVFFFSVAATWSLWPLLLIDRLSDAYACCLVIFLCTYKLLPLRSSDEEVDIFSDRYMTKYFPTIAWLALVGLHVSECIVSPPANLPDIYPVLWSFIGCGLLCVSWLQTIWALTVLSKQDRPNAGRRATGKGRAKPSLRTRTHVLGILFLLCYVEVSEPFLFSPRPLRNKCTACHSGLHLSSDSEGLGDNITDALLNRARFPLQWELQRSSEAKPVLNLSVKRSDMLSLADGARELSEDTDVLVDDQGDDEQSWEDGHVWQSTKEHLTAMCILSNASASETDLTSRQILAEAPQLLRLPTSQVVEAALFLLSYPAGTGQNSTALIKTDPLLLTYCAEDLEYGLEEYLPNMMFMGNQTMASQSIMAQLALFPSMARQLVRMGVDGGLEERQVARALGSAGKSSGKAVEGVVGDMGRSYRDCKRIKGGKGSLG
ncbi:hypothetical protein ACHAWF_014790, partial [Thalassiosira exigua]